MAQAARIEKQVPLDLMLRCCKQSVRVSLQQPDSDVSVQARFWQVSGEVLTVKVLQKKWEESDFPVGTPLYCVFENLGRARTFRSSVIEAVSKPETGALVALRITPPLEILAEDRRKAFRVPVMGVGMVQACLSRKDQEWIPVVRNISVTGALIVLTLKDAEELAVDQRYRLKMTVMGDTAVVICAISRKGSGGRIAVAFPRSTRMGDVHAMPELAKVVRSLEMLWLRKRSGK